MCFSLEASFIASATLAAIGTKTIQITRNKDYLLFSSIPVLFALQQFCEGILWALLSCRPESVWRIVFAHGFLFFAFLVWPIYIPLSLALPEKDKTRKALLYSLILLGITVSALSGFFMFYNGIDARILSCHIFYEITIPKILFPWNAAAYIVAVSVPFFVSSIKYTKYFGVILLISAFASYYIWYYWFTSVWCFFAALLSISIYWILRTNQR